MVWGWIGENVDFKGLNRKVWFRGTEQNRAVQWAFRERFVRSDTWVTVSSGQMGYTLLPLFLLFLKLD